MEQPSLYNLAQMLAEQEAIRAQIKVLSGRDQALEGLIGAVRAYEAAGAEFRGTPLETTPQGDGDTSRIAPNAAIQPRVRIRARRPAPVMQATEVAVSNLMEMLGEPLQTGQMLEFLGTAPDLNLPDENPLNVLSARLSNSSKFQGRRGKGWWFADRPWPGEEDSANESAQESRALDGIEPTSAQDNGGLQPDRLAEMFGEPSTSNPQPGSDSHG
ncbi:hypothetical protein WSK_2087 [Novosphingobium sp. Rr 2-17]|uniref:hypothetical protein n=1 Tax=Novosphingobium sp. Rr 2-17 TaxID=555793 RepID=UPI0002698BAB|nr:hypothetical protein [Novosphingobium sp. Rr 2-17]EIZ79242.1 hypothetical protein WSK_2087 [Novosphingobium sp. Rr 2-17]